MSAGTLFSGLALGVGALLLVAWWQARMPSLGSRIAPHLRAPGAHRRPQAPITPFPTVERILTPLLRDGARLAETWGASRGELEARLRRAGSATTPERFRAEQVIWASGGLVAGLVLSLTLAAARGTSPIALVVMVAAMGAAAVAARDWVLQRSIRRREALITAELPAVAEMLALSVNAGEGALGAVERVARTASGALATNLVTLLGEVHTGTPLADAFSDLADATGVAPLRRFAEAVSVAIDRGTPLADVLHAQAQDVRDSGRRHLMEEGGKREIAMMVPVIFLLLPITVVFAVFPGIVAINIGT